MEIFQYSYMIKALIVGAFLSIIIPCMGVVVVNKKISVIGDALSHVSLAGVMLGLITSTSPVLGALVLCVLGSLFLEYVRTKFPGYQEISSAILMSTGIGLASLFSGFVKTSANFEEYLFGSIIAIPEFDFYLILIVSLVVFILFFYLFTDLMYISFDESSARLSGVNVDRVNLIFMILIAVTISVSARTVGILIISSLMVVPVASAMQFKLGYLKTTILASFFGFIFTITGLVSSFYIGLKPGGAIVLIGVLFLTIILLIKKK
ncbi:metal ABC transporter permease [Peptoniphilus grossensis]|uniref:metal ABC transporter permease n=1 Tax=Peptoniphilus grossensis TaxID=1465756 RepID=UPI0039924CFD